MKTKEEYNRPECEIIDIISEGVIATSGGDAYIGVEDSHSGSAGSKKRDFWD